MNVPKLRFKEFDGEWEEQKLGDITEKIGSGKTPKGGKATYQTEGIALIRSQNIFNDQVNSNDIAYISTETDESMKNSRVFNGDILLNITGASIGRSAVYKKDVIANVNQHVCIIRPKKDYSSDFIQLNISSNKGQKEIEFNQAGGGREGLNFQQIAKMKFNYPSIKEQNKISLLFEKLNKKIQLQQQKIYLLQEQKKGFLQKMFPKAGETQPEMRFKGYKDNWKQKKLEEVTSRVKGNDGRMGLPTLTISASQGWLDQRERFSANIAGKEQKNYTLLKKGQLSYNHGNSKLAKYGVVFELDAYEEALVPRVYHSFETNNLADSKFIQYMFETKRTDKELAKLISSGARMDGLLNINYDEFMGITVSIPDIKEQKKIAEFFIMLNEKINREKEKVRELEKQKQGFMQQMFI